MSNKFNLNFCPCVAKKLRKEYPDVYCLLGYTNSHLKRWFYQKTGNNYDNLIADYFFSGQHSSFNGHFEDNLEKVFQKIKYQFLRLEKLRTENRMNENKMRVFLFLFNIYGMRTVCNLDYIENMEGHIVEQVKELCRMVCKQYYKKHLDFLLFFNHPLVLWSYDYDEVIDKKNAIWYETYIGRQLYYNRNYKYDSLTVPIFGDEKQYYRDNYINKRDDWYYFSEF